MYTFGGPESDSSEALDDLSTGSDQAQIAADAGGDMANKALRLAGEYGYAFEEIPVF
jgi:hypothetical protein